MEKWEIRPSLPQKPLNRSSPKVFYGRQRKSMEKWEIWPPLPQKPLNRLSPKFARVITSGTPTAMQNLITIRLPTFAPQICEKAHQVTQLVFLVLPTVYSQDHCTDFHDQYVKWHGFAQGCAFSGSRKQKFTFRPHFLPKNANFWQIFDGT